MAKITTYGELKSAVTSYIDYNNAEVTKRIPLFISIAEDICNRQVRLPSMERRISRLVLGNGQNTLPVPVDFLELRRMYYDDTLETLDQVDLELLPQHAYVYSDISYDGRPVSFARDQDRWIMSRNMVKDTKINITYYAAVDPMVDDGDSNDLLLKAGVGMLYRAVAEAFRFLERDDRAEVFEQMAEKELLILQGVADKAENTGSVIVQANNTWF